MAESSTLFAKRVHEAMRRIEHSYVRRIAGTSKGGGTHTHVVQFATEAELTAPSLVWDVPDMTYLSTGNDQGAFQIHRAGLYAVTYAFARTVSSNSPVEIRAGTSVDNFASDAKTRARQKLAVSEALADTLHWCGHVAPDWYIWVYNQGAPGGDIDDNQITIARVG